MPVINNKKTQEAGFLFGVIINPNRLMYFKHRGRIAFNGKDAYNVTSYISYVGGYGICWKLNDQEIKEAEKHMKKALQDQTIKPR